MEMRPTKKEGQPWRIDKIVFFYGKKDFFLSIVKKVNVAFTLLTKITEI